MPRAEANARLTPELERTVRQFVLGGLEEALRIELEEMLVTDPDAFEVLGVVEDELIEEYLDGSGTETERQAFERHFLRSPRHDARIRFARALRARASERRAVDTVRSARAIAQLRGRPPLWIGLAAALVVSLASNLWLAWHSGARPAEPPATAAAITPPVATFHLSPGLLRAGGSMTRVSVPSGALVVQLRLDVGGPEFPLYRAALLDEDGGEIRSASKLEAERDAEGAVIVFTLPGQALPRGDYQVQLTGLRDSGEGEVVGTYTFRVTGS